MVAVVALVYGLIRAGDLGSWSAVTVWGPLVAGAVVLTGFVLWELRVGQPAIDMALFRTPRFAGAVTTVLLIFFAAMGQLFFGAFYLQSVKGQSPLVAGLWMVPFAVAQLIFAPRSAGLVRRFGARTVGAVGAACATASFVPFLFMTASTPMWVFGVAFFVEGVGIANIIAPMTEVVMSSVSRAKAGAASAVSNTFRQLGGAFGVAVIGTVLTGAYRAGFRPGLDRVAGLGAGVRDQISGSVTATTGYVEQNAAAHPELTGLLRPGSDAFVHAMHLATIGCVLAAGLGLVITLVLMPRHRAAAPTGQGGAPGAAADAVAATGPGGASAAARG
jgi:Na+/melibiose symporter-like transporter